MTDNVDGLIKSTMGEVERMLSTKTVVGEPIEVGGNTLIPLISMGFGVGAGGGTGTMKSGAAGEGTGSGAGGGGGVKPVAVVVINQEGVRVEPIKGGATSALEKMAEAVGRTVQRGNTKSTD